MPKSSECLQIVPDQPIEMPDPKIYGDDPAKALILKNQDDYLKKIWAALRNDKNGDCHSC